MGTKQNILIVGSGFSGSVLARELAENNYNVTVIDKRDHIGGNAYDYVNEHGILIHKYGAHIFHTNNDFVFKWLSKFTTWIDYKHRVKALLNNELVNFPPTKSYVDEKGLEYVVNTFYKPYTEKMWGLEFNQVDESIINRVKIRDDDNVYYFKDEKYQCLPEHGYTVLFSKILNHPNIKLMLNTEFDKHMEKDYDHVFNSMPIDVYYNFIHGELPYRSIKFRHETINRDRIYDVSVVNFTHTEPETRVIEWKNFPNHGNSNVTTLTYETPCDYKENNYERYYPVKDSLGHNKERFRKYFEIKNDKVTFIGRCGRYAYIDMHQAVSFGIYTAHRFMEKS